MNQDCYQALGRPTQEKGLPCYITYDRSETFKTYYNNVQHCQHAPVLAFSTIDVSVHILANNASAHGGLLTNGLSDICYFFLNYSIELLEIIFDGRAFHYLAVGLVGKKTISECVGRVYNLKKLPVMFT